MEELGLKILGIAFPTVLDLVADLVTSLIDIAFIDGLGMMIKSMLFHMKSR